MFCPESNNIELSEDEVFDYCSSINSEKIDIDNCVNDYKRDN